MFPATNMSGEKLKNFGNHKIIDLVQTRIEHCLLHHMNKKDVVNTLVIQDNIEPCVTELVWQQLEEENQEFFKAYYLKLVVKDQIMEFNRLLAEQVELMNQIEFSEIAPILNSNGSQASPTHQIPTSCAAPSTSPLKPDDMQQQNMFINCGLSIQPFVQGTVDMSIHSRKINVSPSLFLSQNPSMGLSAQTMNRKMVKTEGGDPSVSSFSSVDSSAHHHINDTILDGDASPFGFLPPIPQSFPQLPSDIANSDLLERYCRFPFLATDGNNFMDPNGDIDKLDPASDSLRYQCFGGL